MGSWKKRGYRATFRRVPCQWVGGVVVVALLPGVCCPGVRGSCPDGVSARVLHDPQGRATAAHCGQTNRAAQWRWQATGTPATNLPKRATSDLQARQWPTPRNAQPMTNSDRRGQPTKEAAC